MLNQVERKHLKVTKHAKRRSRQRSGITKGQIDKIAARAFTEGITHKQARGDLSKWMDAEFLKYRTANECRLYANHLYIFHNETLITVLDADLKYEKDLEQYVDSFSTFLKYQRNRIKRKTNPELMKKLSQQVQAKIQTDVNDILRNISPDFLYRLIRVDDSCQLIIAYYTNKRKPEIESIIKKTLKAEYGLTVQFKKMKGDIDANLYNW